VVDGLRVLSGEYHRIKAPLNVFSGGLTGQCGVACNSQSFQEPWAEGITVSAQGCKVVRALLGMGKYAKPVLDRCVPCTARPVSA